MLRSMYSAVSGLRNHQTMMDVIGNNIANVNTTAYKTSRVTFQDVYSQTLSPASAPAGTVGGTNAMQVGLGVSTGSIDMMMDNGATQRTDRTLDLAIDGDTFFIVNDGSSTYYTRAGNFYLDNAGNLITSDGFYVLNSSSAKITIPVAATNITIDKNGLVTGEVGGTKTTYGTIGLAKFVNPEGLMKVGNSLYSASNNSGAATVGAPGAASYGTLSTGALEMSNVDLSKEFTDMITTQRGFQANSRVITVSDTLLEELINLKR